VLPKYGQWSDNYSNKKQNKPKVCRVLATARFRRCAQKLNSVDKETLAILKNSKGKTAYITNNIIAQYQKNMDNS